MILKALILVLFLAGCIAQPTKIKQEVAASEKLSLFVLVDTRSSLQFKSFHVPGSIHLSTEDFLILKNPSTKTRRLDPDIEQTVERLSKKGITPLKGVKLIADQAGSAENKKWQWLLKKLNITQIELIALSDYIEKNRPLRPQASPESRPKWTVTDVRSILEKSDSCFVNWSDTDCY